MSQTSDDIEKVTRQISDKGPPIVEKIIDKLTGMNTQITYDFNNLEIGLPNAEGPNGKQIARGKLTINGGLKVSTAFLKEGR
jgi:hypothetical protein